MHSSPQPWSSAVLAQHRGPQEIQMTNRLDLAQTVITDLDDGAQGFCVLHTFLGYRNLQDARAKAMARSGTTVDRCQVEADAGCENRC